MTQTRPNGAKVPVNSDEYSLTADLAKMADTIPALIPVPDQATRDAIPKYPGLAVIRLDKTNAPVEIWDGSTWRLQPIIEIGQGSKPPIFKSKEVAVTLNAFLVGDIYFDTPFPTALVSCGLERRHTTAGAVTFTIVSGPTNAVRVQFTASGATAGSVIYVTYQAWGY